MRFQSTIMTKLGTFNSDVTHNVTTDDMERIERMFKNAHNTDSFWINRGSETIYFPANVIRNSVLILDIQEDEK
ncbi:hypothetical protein LCGC14_1552440 [marine sediment metagenome]|uniref:Uncharacterized protein n=2 Tax=marine sediment metagenome TaxID=412755 RepID=A0A0F9HE65_9ZZZZ